MIKRSYVGRHYGQACEVSEWPLGPLDVVTDRGGAKAAELIGTWVGPALCSVHAPAAGASVSADECGTATRRRDGRCDNPRVDAPHGASSGDAIVEPGLVCLSPMRSTTLGWAPMANHEGGIMTLSINVFNLLSDGVAAHRPADGHRPSGDVTRSPGICSLRRKGCGAGWPASPGRNRGARSAPWQRGKRGRLHPGRRRVRPLRGLRSEPGACRSIGIPTEPTLEPWWPFPSIELCREPSLGMGRLHVGSALPIVCAGSPENSCRRRPQGASSIARGARSDVTRRIRAEVRARRMARGLYGVFGFVVPAMAAGDA